MTVVATASFSTATGNGATTAFPFNFACRNLGDVAVYLNGTLQASGFTVVLGSDFNSGTVTFTSAPASGAAILIASSPSMEQQIGFENAGPYNPVTVDGMADAAAIRDIYIKGLTDRAPKVPLGEIMGPIPALTSRAGLFFGFDASGNPVALNPGGADSALRTDLAASGGSALAGFIVSGAGASARNVQSKLRDFPTVEDFGAVGDGITDDTAAIQAALNACKGLKFAPKTYYSATGVTVPTTCHWIEGGGAQMSGPGAGSSVDGFTFTGFHQGPSTYPTWHQGFKGERYRLPSVTNFRHGVALVNAAFLPVEIDVVSFCASGVYIQATSGTNNWAVQNIVKVGLALQCTNALEIDCNSGSVQGIQGGTYDFRYVSGCSTAIKGTFNSASSNVNFNILKFGTIDGTGTSGNIYAVNFAYELTNSINTFEFDNEPINMSPAAGNTPYVNVDKQEMVISGQFIGDDFSPYHFGGFLPGGPRTTAKPASGTMTVYVDQSIGTTGNGSSGAPFKTIAEAVTAILKMDGYGNAAVIQLAGGTYTEAVSIDTTAAGNGHWSIILAGVLNTPASVTMAGGITIQGAVKVTVQDVTATTNSIIGNYRAQVALNRVNFGAAAGKVHISALNGATFDIQANYTISGGAASHFQASLGGRINCPLKTITVTGTPAFSFSFAQAIGAGSMIDTTGTTFSGSGTGPYYSATLLGLINTNGAGSTYFPGSTTGNSATGGVYA